MLRIHYRIDGMDISIVSSRVFLQGKMRLLSCIESSKLTWDLSVVFCPTPSLTAVTASSLCSSNSRGWMPNDSYTQNYGGPEIQHTGTSGNKRKDANT